MTILTLLQLLCTIIFVMLALNIMDLILYKRANNAMRAYMESVSIELDLHLAAISVLEKENQVLRNRIEKLENSGIGVDNP